MADIRHLAQVLCVVLTPLLVSSCSDSSDLGNNLFLLEGDKKEDRVIVYCTGKDFSGCYSGSYMIPTYNEHMKNGSYNEYVELVHFDKNWIIVRSVQMEPSSRNYWIVNKNFGFDWSKCDEFDCIEAIRSKIIGPLNYTDYRVKKDSLDIELEFVSN